MYSPGTPVSTVPEEVTVGLSSSPSTAVAPASVYVEPASTVAGLSPVIVITGAVSSTSVIVTVMSCVDELVPSLTVTVAVTEVVVSKSGALTKVRTPVEELISSVEPETENVKSLRSPSASDAVTVPIAV